MKVTKLPRVEGFSIQPHMFVESCCSFIESLTALSELKKSVEEYGNPSKIRPKCPSLSKAIQDARKQFSIPGKIMLLHLFDVFKQDLDLWTEPPGLPWCDLNYSTKDDIKHDSEAIQRVRNFWRKVEDHKKPPADDCLLFNRSRGCEDGTIRDTPIWCYPASITFGEAVFAIPLIKAYREQSDSPFAFGYECAIEGMSKVINRMLPHGDCTYFVLNYKNFNGTVPIWLINLAFLIMAENISFIRFQSQGEADPRRMWLSYMYIEDYFINTTIRVCDGTRYKKCGGIPGGSCFTELVGSIVNYILIRWICHRQDVECLDVLVLGDDSLTAVKGDFKLSDAQNLLAETIGMNIDLEKSQISNDLSAMKFLGHYVKDCIIQKDFSEWAPIPSVPSENGSENSF